jgi:hypothetical protein
MGRWAVATREPQVVPARSVYSVQPARRMLSLAVVPAYAGRVADRVAE